MVYAITKEGKGGADAWMLQAMVCATDPRTIIYKALAKAVWRWDDHALSQSPAYRSILCLQRSQRGFPAISVNSVMPLEPFVWRTMQFVIKTSETTAKPTYRETFVHYMMMYQARSRDSTL